jgi:TetR/AcrR family transcriptional repressor of nem operon
MKAGRKNIVTSRGEKTRDRILDAMQEIILTQGYANASVDRVLEKTGLTKGAFFYHYKNKNELIKALIDRYAQEEAETLNGVMKRSEELSRDPLQQLLIAIGFLIELGQEAAGADSSGPIPGCLFGSYAYQIDAFVPEVHEVLQGAALQWRAVVRQKMEEAAQVHPPRADIDLADLADGLLLAYEGGFIMGRMLNKPDQFVRGLKSYRSFLELAFGLQ